MKTAQLVFWLLTVPLAPVAAQTLPTDPLLPAPPAGSPPEVTAITGKKESKWFVRIQGSYGLAAPGAFRPYNSYVTYPDSARPGGAHKTNRQGLGQGLRAGLGVGYILNDLINVGLDAEVYRSRRVSSNDVSGTLQGSTHATHMQTHTGYAALDAGLITVTPSITFKAISKSAFYLYARLGVSAALSTRVRGVGVETSDTKILRTGSAAATIIPANTRDETVAHYQYKGGMAFGYLAALGMQTKISDRIRFFSELQANSITYSPRKKILTKYLSNGVDLLQDPAFPKRRRETEYLKSFTRTYSPNADQSPEKATKLAIPFSSINLSAGLAFRF
jgi:hypothetical protein